MVTDQQNMVRRLLTKFGAVPRFVRRRPKMAIVLLIPLAGLFVGLVALIQLNDSGTVAIRRIQTVADALEKLDNEEYDAARKIAVSLNDSSTVAFEDQGTLPYVVGVSLQHEAEEHWNPVQQRRLFLVAARYLEAARDKGFPKDREADGLYRLGNCLFQAQHYALCLPVLLEARDVNPDLATEIDGLLSIAYYRDSNPQLAKALQYSQSYLSDSELSPEDRHRGLYHQSQILLRQGEVTASKSSLASIPVDSQWKFEILLMQARILLFEGDRLLALVDPSDADRSSATAKYREAIERLQQAHALNAGDSDSVPKVQLLLGLSHRRLNELQAAEKHFTRTRRLHVDTPEGWIAGLEEAELQQMSGKDDASLSTFQHVLAEMGDPAAFSNPWISLDEAKDRILASYDRFVATQKYEYAIGLAKDLTFVVTPAKAVQLEANASRHWAEQLETDPTMVVEARQQWRKAGNTFAQLAQLRITTQHYSEDLWNASDCHMRGQNYEYASKLLEVYLGTESRRLRPRGLVAMGQAQLALHHIDKALAPLQECIEFYPRHPKSYTARLVASEAYLEKGRLKPAIELLEANLYEGSLDPKSYEWRDSLFALGGIHHVQGTKLEAASRLSTVSLQPGEKNVTALQELERAHQSFQRAIETLEEAIARYPDVSQAILARYQIAESYRQASKLPRMKLPSETIESSRSSLNRQIRDLLGSAERTYQELVEILNTRQENQELAPLEQAILRNSYFARADALFDLSDYDEAILAYSTATSRYQSEPEALEAFVQISNCYRRLNRDEDARGTLEQAKVVLGRVREDADFRKTTRYTRDDWTKYLDWLSSF